MARGRDTNAGSLVKPAEARRQGNDPDAVRVGSVARDAGTEDGPEARPDGRRVETAPEVARKDYRGADVGRGADAALAGRRDSARWGPIWAGLITALTTFLLLELLTLGTGLLSFNLGSNSANQVSGWVSAIIGLVAFFTGGSVAGMTSAVRGASTGLLNGFLVWALGTVLMLVLSALGLGQVFGAVGNLVGQLNLLAGGSLNVPGVNFDPQQLINALRTGALVGFFSLLISAVAAALGGWLGGRTDEPIGHIAKD